MATFFVNKLVSEYIVDFLFLHFGHSWILLKEKI